MALLKARAPAGSDNLWSDDSVELFLQPDPGAARYLHLLVNSRGCSLLRQYPDSGRRIQAKCAVRLEKDRWVVLVALDRGIVRAAGRVMGFHACRNRKAGVNEVYFWKWTGGHNHRPEYFGLLKI